MSEKADRAQYNIAAARRVVGDFGIASECGWGRADPGRLPGLLASCRLAADSLR